MDSKQLTNNRFGKWGWSSLIGNMKSVVCGRKWLGR